MKDDNGGTLMSNTKQPCSSKIRRGAASTVLTLVVVLGLGIFTAQSAQAQTFTVLWPFAGDPAPANPYAGLFQDTAGNLYGTTLGGGTSGAGTVFKVTKSGKDTVLYNFCAYNCTVGYNPYAGLIQDTAGNLYGTTYYGGTTSNDGAVFKVSKSGQETVLYSFAGGTTDGCNPEGGLLRDTAGNFYGTTYGCGANGYGTVFKLSPGKTWTVTILHSFAYSDGANPYLTSLLTDAKGNLYGITSKGGGGYGTVYKLSIKSKKFTLLYSFTGGTADGCYSSGTPLMDAKGNLYGTAEACGSSNLGIVWKLSKKGKETVLHNFAGGTSDGANPYAGVIMDTAGNLYGTTSAGGASNLGTVYELKSKRTLTVLHSFASSDGANPYAGVIRDKKGDFYGTTETGGSGGYGTVWKLTP
jgi:uncharacterized repeat protein (TIGR03803 family)